jgi:hypothetical protein
MDEQGPNAGEASVDPIETHASADPERQAIQTVLDAKLRNKLLVRQEIKRLPDLVEPGEELVTAASGRYEDRNGLLAITDRRILFVDDGFVRKRVEEFHYNRVSSIQWKSGMLSSMLTIVTSGNKATIKDVMPKERAQEIAGYVSKRISGDITRPAAPAVAAPAPAEAPAGPSPIEQLKQLGELRDAGVLTDGEFEAKKAELLKRV